MDGCKTEKVIAIHGTTVPHLLREAGKEQVCGGFWAPTAVDTLAKSALGVQGRSFAAFFGKRMLPPFFEQPRVSAERLHKKKPSAATKLPKLVLATKRAVLIFL